MPRSHPQAPSQATDLMPSQLPAPTWHQWRASPYTQALEAEAAELRAALASKGEPEVWHAVLSPSRDEGVIFKDRADAVWTATGQQDGRYGVPTIGAGFRESYTDTDAFVIVDVVPTPSKTADAEPVASPTSDMNLGQRIAHVGGRTNAQGYIEFGSPMAVGSLIQQVLRDIARPGDGGSFQARYRSPGGEWSSWGAVMCGVKGHEQELRYLPTSDRCIAVSAEGGAA